jgi:acyl-CoA reductase-like NAD-dependent aldehyde dehydrogenase
MNVSMKNKVGSNRKSKAPNKNMTICINPATCEKIAEYEINTIEDVKDAVKKAKAAQVLWARTPIKKRKKLILKIRDHIVNNIDGISDIISRDNGKTRTDAIVAEVVPATMAISFYCRKAASFLKDRKLPMGNIMFFNKRSRIVRQPFGVVGIIAPWNYPFSIPFSEVIMALLAGNAVILKTASETQAVGHALKECIDAAGLPENVFTYINLPGSLAGDAFLEAGIDKLFFTGSVPVGKYLMKKASETLTPVSLELGGNDPMIVCEDADLKRAAAGAVWAGLQNAGQSCGGVERIYVQSKVYFEFLGLLKTAVESLRVGYDTDFNVDIGAMTTRRQMDTVKMHIDDALKKHAIIFAQSKFPEDGKGQFMPCVVLTEVNHDMLVMKDETFGPVLGVMPYEDIEEAIRLSNDSYLGLTASVWSKNRKKAMNIGRKIQAGAITINDHLMSHGLAETPWGGFKQSALGRSHGDIGFAEMTQPQVVVNDLMPFARKNLWWHPFSKTVYDGLKGIAYLLYSKNPFRRVKGAFQLMKVFPRTFRSN